MIPLYSDMRLLEASVVVIIVVDVVMDGVVVNDVNIIVLALLFVSDHIYLVVVKKCSF